MQATETTVMQSLVRQEQARQEDARAESHRAAIERYNKAQSPIEGLEKLKAPLAELIAAVQDAQKKLDDAKVTLASQRNLISAKEAVHESGINAAIVACRNTAHPRIGRAYQLLCRTDNQICNSGRFDEATTSRLKAVRTARDQVQTLHLLDDEAARIEIDNLLASVDLNLED